MYCTFTQLYWLMNALLFMLQTKYLMKLGCDDKYLNLKSWKEVPSKLPRGGLIYGYCNINIDRFLVESIHLV